MKYEIYMEGYPPQTATVIIEADDEDEAEEIAIAMAEDGEIDCEDCDWSCYRTEVIEVSEYEEITDEKEITSIKVFHEFVEQINLTKELNNEN